MVKNLLAAVALLSLAVPAYAQQAHPNQQIALAECQAVYGESPYCDHVSAYGLSSMQMLQPYSWVSVKANSILRSGPGLDEPSAFVTQHEYLFVASAVMTVPGDSYRWVEVEVVDGIDTYIFYVREDRISTSAIDYE